MPPVRLWSDRANRPSVALPQPGQPSLAPLPPGERPPMLDALDVHRSLLAREVPHEVVRLPRLVLSADELPTALDLPASRCVAVRMYLADEAPVAVIVRAGELPHPGAVLAAAGARSLRPARPDAVNTITDFAAPLVC